jgi:hypothetical protein
MTARTTAREALTDCPACDRPITAEVAYDLTLDTKGDQGGERTATLTPVGARISHDCMPKVYRGTGLSGAQLESFERKARQ